MKAASTLVMQKSTGNMQYPLARANMRRATNASNQGRFDSVSAPTYTTVPSTDTIPSPTFSPLAPGVIAAVLMLVTLAGVAGWMLRQLFNLWFG